jgi:hypothetical protein
LISLLSVYDKFVAAVEAMLGIDREGEETPSATDRMSECLERLQIISDTLLNDDTPSDGQNTPVDEQNDVESVNPLTNKENPTDEPETGQNEGIDDPGVQGYALPFPCPECERSFSTKQGLNTHMRTHNRG